MTSSVIQTVRADFMDALKKAVPGVPVLTSIPSSLYPPALIVSEGDPFILPPSEHPDWVFQFEILALVAPSADNNRMVSILDDLVSSVLEGLAGEYPATVAAYTTQSLANEQPLLGARLSIRSTGWTITRKETD